LIASGYDRDQHIRNTGADCRFVKMRCLSAIQKHGRWRSTRTVLEYIEAGRVFTASAVNVLFSE
jgi:hypothetical protein